MNEIRTLLSLELRSIYGINKFLHTKDKSAKNRYTLLLCVWVFLALMLAGYIAGLAYGLSVLGLSDIVPAYIVFLASILIFAVGIFKAGAALFSKNSYDMLSSMPVRVRSIVISRFISMYIEYFSITLLIMLPGILTLGIIEKPDISFYISSISGSLFIPLIPLCVSIIFGTLVFAVSSRVKHKSLIQTVFTILLVIAVMALSFGMVQFDGELSPELFADLANTISGLIGKIYPPAVWLGSSIIEINILLFALFSLVSIASLFITVTVASFSFSKIMTSLFSFSARHNYKLGEMKSSTALKTLYVREAKRYFSSSIYVTNTIIGPIMAVIASIALCITGIDRIASSIPIAGIEKLVPLAISAISCMMTATSVSLSMEGKQFSLIKSFPIDVKALFDSKILLNLSLMLPSYLISEICMIIALNPAPSELIWVILIPALIMLFSTVFGITVNLKLHSFDWENEVTVVKQSAPAALGGFAGPLLSLVLIGIMIVVPNAYSNLAFLLISIALFSCTALLYHKNNKAKLEML